MIRRCVKAAVAWLCMATGAAFAAGDTLETCLSQPESYFLGFDRQDAAITLSSPNPLSQPRTFTLDGRSWTLPSRNSTPLVRAAGPQGGVLLFQDEAGNERYRLSYKPDIKAPPVQLSAPGARAASPLVLPAANSIVFTSTAGEGELWGILEYRPDAPKRVLFQDAGAWQVIAASADDNTLLMQEIFGLYDRVLYIADRASGLKSPIFIGKRPLAVRSGALSPDGKTAYVMLAGTSRQGAILEVDIYNGKVAPLMKTDWPLSAMALTKDGKRIAAFENRNGATWIHAVDLDTRAPLASSQAGGWAYDLTFSQSGTHLGYTLERPGHGATAVTHVLGEKASGLTSASCAPARLTSLDLARAEGVTGQQTLPVFLIEPATAPSKPRPVLIVFHGGPEGQWRQTGHAALFAMAADLDIAILLPNIAGSTGYGLRYSAADDGAKRNGVLKDIALLLDWVAANPQLDSDRIGVSGASYGGYLAMLAQSQFNDRVAGAASEVGIADLSRFLSETPITRRRLRRSEYGDERDAKMRKRLSALSPLTHVANITKPVFLVHGRNDARVPVNQSILMADALRAQNTPAALHLIDTQGHIIRDQSIRLDVSRKALKFWSQVLQP